MNGKIFLMTFTAVFLAELADKTQIVGMAMAAKSGKPVVVWLGSVSAYLVITILTVLLGAALGKYLKPDLIRYLGGSLFVVIGMLMFFKVV